MYYRAMSLEGFAEPSSVVVQQTNDPYSDIQAHYYNNINKAHRPAGGTTLPARASSKTTTKSPQPSDDLPFPAAESAAGWKKSPVLTRLGPYQCLETGYYREISVVVVEDGGNDPTVFAPTRHQQKQLRLGELLNRLRNAFRDLSLSVRYEDSPSISACCTVGLESRHQLVEFDVTVHRLRGSTGTTHTDPNGVAAVPIVVQVHRRSGDAALVKKYANEIFQAAENGSAASPYPPCIDSPVAKTVVVPSLCRRLDAHCSQQQQHSVDSALEVTLQLLNSECYDARRLGLESLAGLTDPNRTGFETALAVSRALVLGTDHDENRSAGRTIVGLVATGRWNDDRDSSMDCDDDDNNNSNSGAAGDGSPLVYLALVALTNSLVVLEAHYCGEQQQTADQSSAMQGFLERVQQWTGLDLVRDVLLRYICNAGVAPHLAYHSLLALTALVRLLPTATLPCIQPETIQYAEQVGRHSHAALGQASSQLLHAMHVF